MQQHKKLWFGLAKLFHLYSNHMKEYGTAGIASELRCLFDRCCVDNTESPNHIPTYCCWDNRKASPIAISHWWLQWDWTNHNPINMHEIWSSRQNENDDGVFTLGECAWCLLVMSRMQSPIELIFHKPCPYANEISDADARSGKRECRKPSGLQGT